jgi:hypothetical protein
VLVIAGLWTIYIVPISDIKYTPNKQQTPCDTRHDTTDHGPRPAGLWQPVVALLWAYRISH